MYYQQKNELTIPVPIESSKPRSEWEDMAWEIFITIIYSAALSTVGNNEKIRWISKEQKAKVIEL
jgi:hypothetical protein